MPGIGLSSNAGGPDGAGVGPDAVPHRSGPAALAPAAQPLDETTNVKNINLLIQLRWIAVVGQVPGTEHYRNVLRHDVVTQPHVLSLRVDESLYFANARMLEDTIYDAVATRPELKHVVLMCPAVNMIDASALESLEAIAHRLTDAGVGFHLSEVKGPVMDRLKRSDFFEHFAGRVFLSQHEAATALETMPSAKAQQVRPTAAPAAA